MDIYIYVYIYICIYIQYIYHLVPSADEVRNGAFKTTPLLISIQYLYYRPKLHTYSYMLQIFTYIHIVDPNIYIIIQNLRIFISQTQIRLPQSTCEKMNIVVVQQNSFSPM